MKALLRSLVVLSVLLPWGAARSAPARRPSVGYLYPAGGRQGVRLRLTVGGQFLRKASRVLVSGEGVSARVVEFCRPLRGLDDDQRSYLKTRFEALWRTQLDALYGVDRPPRMQRPLFGGKRWVERESMDMGSDLMAGMEALDIPRHPLFEGAEEKSLRELFHLRKVLFANRGMRQPNRQLAEVLVVDVQIAPDAPPGDRELRVLTPQGLTAPRLFQVDTLPEARELEPNDRVAAENLPGLGKDSPPVEAMELPVVWNGQILPGDVDRFRFRARAGQRVVIEARARQLIPYLADAVPGWFQATLALYDASGRELAYQDDHGFDPDPVLTHTIPEDGEYEVAIHDSIYRGREDFVYRLRVHTGSFVTRHFPLGGPRGESVLLALGGENLRRDSLAWRVPGEGGDVAPLPLSRGESAASGLRLQVSELPAQREQEPNDRREQAQPVRLPRVVDGRIGKRGDVDHFAFSGRGGQRVVAAISARSLGSPLDSLLRLLGPGGEVLAWSDDHVLKERHLHRDAAGLLTHHADSYLVTRLPRDGTYQVQVRDTQRQGGPGHSYRLRLSEPRPDFVLRVTPSSLAGRPGEFLPVRVHVLRRDGFEGSVRVELRDAPGFEIQGGRIPEGVDRVTMTLRTPHQVAREGVARVFSPVLVGTAEVGGVPRTRVAVPADDVMQAFLYRHLVPARSFVVVVDGSRHRAPPLRRQGQGPLRIVAGGAGEARFRFPGRRALSDFELELHEPPSGVSLGPLEATEKGARFQVRLAPDGPDPGFRDNLVVQVYRRRKAKQKAKQSGKGKKAGPKRHLVGVLPALPLVVVGR